MAQKKPKAKQFKKPNKRKKLSLSLRFNKRTALLFIAVIAVAGGVSVFLAHAADESFTNPDVTNNCNYYVHHLKLAQPTYNFYCYGLYTRIPVQHYTLFPDVATAIGPMSIPTNSFALTIYNYNGWKSQIEFPDWVNHRNSSVTYKQLETCGQTANNTLLVTAVSTPKPASAYILSAYGSVVVYGKLPPGVTSGSGCYQMAGTPTWNFNIARDIKITDPNTDSGYILDGYGGIHPLGRAPAVHGAAYWPNWDIARKMILLPNNTGGYVMDGYGGLHAFALGNNPMPPAPKTTGYWPGQDIAKDIVINPAGNGGYVLDAAGGIHTFTIPQSGVKNPAIPVPKNTTYYDLSGKKAVAIYITDWSKPSGIVLTNDSILNPFNSPLVPQYQ